MPSYKLLYFDARGAAEVSRLVFAAAGQEFVDVRFSREDWPNIKADQPMQQMPVLEVDGKKYCQGNAIARYLAKEFGLFGNTSLEYLRIEELLEVLVDLMKEFIAVYHEEDDTKKTAMMKTLAEDTLPKYMDFYTRRLCENNEGDGFFVGDGLSLGDLVVYNGLFSANRFLGKFGNADIFANYPKLKAHNESIEALPRIAEWLKKRLFGNTSLEYLRIEELLEVLVDLMKEFIAVYHEEDDTKKTAMMKTLAEDTLPKYMDFYTRRLCENNEGDGFFVGDGLSLGDLVVYNGLFSANRFLGKFGNADIFANYPKLKAHNESIEALPRIAEWLKKRPVTEM